MSEAVANGRRKTTPFWVGLVVTGTIAVTGWVLLAQGWAKDAGHEVLKLRIETVESIDVQQNETLSTVVVNQERILTNQENFKAQLDRIERKVSP